MLSQKMLLPFRGMVSATPPVWLMRQAGRYLPEYRKVREKFPSFIDFCLHPEAVCAVTLQPIQRFGFDAAILFSDILLLPALLGQPVFFKEKEGPSLAPLAFHQGDLGLSSKRFREGLLPVLEAISWIRQGLAPETTLIGFAGAPWTVAAYMLEGGGSKDFAQAKILAGKHPLLFQSLMDLLIQETQFFLDAQIRSGVEVIQLFESWAGIVPAPFFQKWVIEPTQQIVSFLKKEHPSVPMIGFPKGAGVGYEKYALETGVDGLSLDFSFPLEEALSFPVVLQGNLDPALLAAGGPPLQAATQFILRTVENKPFVFNLGHGILPQTPLDHVKHLLDTIRGYENSGCPF